jgi:uncharacterized protein YwqG
VAVTTDRCPEEQFPVGGTKLGGLPSLPAGTKWPRCERGPLEFLGQFDLAELHRTVAGQALPASGLLSFFLSHNNARDEFGGPSSRGGVPGGLRVLHTPAGARLRRLRPPPDLTADLGLPYNPCRVSLADTLDLPDLDDTWAERYGPAFQHPELARYLLSPALRGYQFAQAKKRFPDLRPSAHQVDHQLFGYAHATVIHQDPIPGPDWQLLVSFSSDRKTGFGWGDGHPLFWYIRTADLNAGHFEDTRAEDG